MMPQDGLVRAALAMYKFRPKQKEGSMTGDNTPDAPRLIDERIAGLTDWRGPMLAKLRAIIIAADASVIEEWKWQNPVWSSSGLICTGESYRKAIKLTFAKGAALDDPEKLFNSSLTGNVRRAIDFTEGAEINETALTALVRAAIQFNRAK